MNDVSSVEMSTINPMLQVSAQRRQRISVSDATIVPDLEKVAEMSGAAIDVSAEPGPRNIGKDEA